MFRANSLSHNSIIGVRETYYPIGFDLLYYFVGFSNVSERAMSEKTRIQELVGCMIFGILFLISMSVSCFIVVYLLDYVD